MQISAMSKFFDNVCDQFGSLPSLAKALIGASAIVVPVYFIFYRNRQKSSLLKKDFKNGVVYLYQFPRSLVIPNLSSYCLKLETWLRMADIDYENVDCSPMIRSSKGLLPFIEFNGRQYADSDFIIRDLTRIFNKFEMESSLSIEQKSIARAFEQMIENSTTQCTVYVKWVENSEKFMSEKIFGPLPFIFKTPFPRLSLKKNVKQRLVAHGIGRHSLEDIISIGSDDLRSLSKYMGTKKFFGGDQPTKIDASLFGLLAQLVYIPIETPFTSLMKNECQNLIQYCDRMKGRFWPDWNEVLTTKSLHTKWKKN